MKYFSVVVGAHNLQYSEKSQRRYRIRQIVIHENYTRKAYPYDIALLRLKRSIKFNDQTRPICVDNSTFAPYSKCMVTGWGVTHNTYPSSMYSVHYTRDLHGDKITPIPSQTFHSIPTHSPKLLTY